MPRQGGICNGWRSPLIKLVPHVDAFFGGSLVGLQLERRIARVLILVPQNKGILIITGLDNFRLLTAIFTR